METHTYKIKARYRFEDPIFPPLVKTKNRHNEKETRLKNRRNRKRLKNSKR